MRRIDEILKQDEYMGIANLPFFNPSSAQMKMNSEKKNIFLSN
jgi:hypothetical protein